MSKISVGEAACLRSPQLEILNQVQDDEGGGRVQRERPEILPLNNPDDLAVLSVLPLWTSKVVAKRKLD